MDFYHPGECVAERNTHLPRELRGGKRLPSRSFISGSSSQNRDKEIFEHNPYLRSAEYYQIEETLAPEVMQDIAEWINRLH